MTIEQAKNAAAIVFDANKSLIGRTRLQKLGCLYELAGVGTGFSYAYHHYGPFSKELSVAIEDANAIDLVHEEVKFTDWGNYSIYSCSEEPMASNHAEVRSELAKIAKKASNVEFELAVTAAFISSKGVSDPWIEVSIRKPKKAEHILSAKALYAKLQEVETPSSLPELS